MSSKQTYIATAPTGQEFVKISARTITHAVLVFGTKWDNADLHWRALSFAGTEAAARKTADSNRGRINDQKIVIVPVAVR